MGGRHEDEIHLICGEVIKSLPTHFEETDEPYDDFDELWNIIKSCYSKRFHERAFATWAFPGINREGIEIWLDVIIGNHQIYNSQRENIWVCWYKHEELQRVKNRLSHCKIPHKYTRSFSVVMDCVEVALNEGWDLVIGFKGDTWSQCEMMDYPS